MNNRPELIARLNSLVNHYGSDAKFASHVDKWPRTIRELIYNSMELMIRFKLVELIPDPMDDYQEPMD